MKTIPTNDILSISKQVTGISNTKLISNPWLSTEGANSSLWQITVGDAVKGGYRPNPEFKISRIKFIEKIIEFYEIDGDQSANQIFIKGEEALNELLSIIKQSAPDYNVETRRKAEKVAKGLDSLEIELPPKISEIIKGKETYSVDINKSNITNLHELLSQNIDSINSLNKGVIETQHEDIIDRKLFMPAYAGDSCNFLRESELVRVKFLPENQQVVAKRVLSRDYVGIKDMLISGRPENSGDYLFQTHCIGAEKFRGLKESISHTLASIKKDYQEALKILSKLGEFPDKSPQNFQLSAA